jgi:putative peptidoglycan lipid II flippase
VTLSMISVMTPLARPIVRVLFEHRAFGAPASGLVSSLVICYVLGSTFYLARDVLVRVFYALGDGQTPFYISLAAIVANAALDWLLVRFGGFGAPGLVLATMVVNIASAGALLTQLSSRLGGLQLSWERPVLLLVGCSLYSSAITRVSYDQIFVLLSRRTSHWIVDFTSLGLASTVGVMSFFAPLVFVQVPEIRSVLQLALSRFDSEMIQ